MADCCMCQYVSPGDRVAWVLPIFQEFGRKHNHLLSDEEYALLIPTVFYEMPHIRVTFSADETAPKVDADVRVQHHIEQHARSLIFDMYPQGLCHCARCGSANATPNEESPPKTAYNVTIYDQAVAAEKLYTDGASFLLNGDLPVCRQCCVEMQTKRLENVHL